MSRGGNMKESQMYESPEIAGMFVRQNDGEPAHALQKSNETGMPVPYWGRVFDAARGNVKLQPELSGDQAFESGKREVDLELVLAHE